GRGQHDRERLLQGRAERAADGIRRGGPEAAGRQAGRRSRLERTGARSASDGETHGPVTMTEPLLEIRDLHASVDGTEILHGLSLTINAGEVHAIMGTNGSGKSTLTKVIAGHPDYEVTGGDVLFKGRSILQDEPEERACAGIFLAFQYPVEVP